MGNKKANFYFFLISVFFITNCKTASNNFSYKTSTYSIENETKSNQVYLNSYLISFNGYLLEFNVGVSTIDSIFGGSNKLIRQYKYDTLSVFVLDSKKRIFYEFNEFSNKSKLLKFGPFSKKPSGMRLADTAQKLTIKVQKQKMFDTLLWGVNLHYLIDTQKNRINEDSVRTFVFFLKNKKFVSLYEIMTAEYINPDFSMVGFSANFIDQKIVMEGVMEELRTLTTLEEDICSGMIQKIKQD
ncbi:MAG: hypothetical protein MUE72_01720 [Chitinophagaceae bacterium]|nr:hypothetical protein [Chitinophagaceae bacterium]